MISGVGPLRTIDTGKRLPKHVFVSADYTAKLSDRIIGVDTSAIAITITIPSAAITLYNNDASQIYAIKDEVGNAFSNNITIATEGSETIDGLATQTINVNYDSIGIYSDGTDLFTL